MLILLLALTPLLYASNTVGQNQSEVFSSIEKLSKLSRTQSDVVVYMKEFVQNQYERLKTAEKFIEKFETIANKSKKNPKKFMGNPVNAFLVIKQLIKDVPDFFGQLNTNDEINKTLNEMRKKLLMPTNDDYNGTAILLQNLEDIYELSTAQIQQGIFGKSQSFRALNAFECFELGRIAQTNEDHYHAVRWFAEAVKRADKEGEFATISKSQALEYLAHSVYKQGNIFHAISFLQNVLLMDPTNKKAFEDLTNYQKILDEKLNEKIDQKSSSFNDLVKYKNERRLLNDTTFSRDSYESLCREKGSKISPKRLSKLKCRYVNHHPMLKIAPIKEEKIFDQVPIWLYHDIISKKQAEKMIALSKPKLKRVVTSSVSQNGWVLDSEDKQFLPRLTKLISAITNLSLDNSDPWLASSYGPGGFYLPHQLLTSSDDYDKKHGIRMATWINYVNKLNQTTWPNLEAPEIGGATVFPEIGARVTPISRSAIFWYNLPLSGKLNKFTNHAECPVLVGSKWTYNRLIRMV